MLKHVALCLSIATPAISAQILLPPFLSTTPTVARTRGFFFQTPVAITITGLRVPDDSKNGTQVVEILKLGGTPPEMPATATGTQLFYKKDQPSDVIVPCSVAFAANDWVGVLGACGDAIVMRNSDGVTPFSSNVLGFPITLRTLVTDSNLTASGGNQPFSTAVSLPIGRVEVYVKNHNVAIDYGVGSAVGLVSPPLLTTIVRPVLGATAMLVLNNNNLPNIGGMVAISSGRAVVPFGMGTILIKLPVIVSFWVGAPMTLGPTAVFVSIPNDPSLLAAPPLDLQGFVATGANVALSNGTEWLLGR